MKILNFGSCNIDYVYSMDHIVKVGETEVAFVAKKNTLTQPEADAFNTLISEFIPNLTTVTVTATLTVYNNSYQINLQPQTVITEDPSMLKAFAGMLIDNEFYDCTDAAVGTAYAESWMVLADAYTSVLSEAESRTLIQQAGGGITARFLFSKDVANESGQ